jgi:photosystem II stability/assembly factor-like uncharacterized protein
MKRIIYACALLVGLVTGCKSSDVGPAPTLPTGPVLLDNGSVKVTIVTAGVPANAKDVYFKNSQAGIVVTGDGKIFQTQDGGGTWVVRYANPSVEQPLNQVLFTNANVGYAVGGTYQCSGTGCVPLGGRIVKTTDGGATWASVLELSGVDIPSIAVNDAGELFAVANASTARIYKSADRGSSWQVVASEPFQLTKIAFDRSQGLCTSASGKVISSPDGGSTWREAATFNYPYLSELAFAAGIGFSVEGYGKVYRTTDNGNTWAPTSSSMYSARVIKVLTPSSSLILGAGLYSGGDFGTYNGSLRQTKDAGTNWMESAFTSDGPIGCASFYTTTAGYAVAGKQLLSVQLY